MIVFSIPITPRPKGRPRATVRGGFASLYTDAKTRKFEADVREVAAAAMRGKRPFEGPLSVSIRFRLPIAASATKKTRAAILAGDLPFYGAHDVDNLAKAVLDAFNGVCWPDDKQITRLFVVKVASETPGIDVRIQPLR